MTRTASMQFRANIRLHSLAHTLQFAERRRIITKSNDTLNRSRPPAKQFGFVDGADGMPTPPNISMQSHFYRANEINIGAYTMRLAQTHTCDHHKWSLIACTQSHCVINSRTCVCACACLQVNLMGICNDESSPDTWLICHIIEIEWKAQHFDQF